MNFSPRRPETQSFLWYQHAVVSGYGMLDDFKLGLKNVRNIFGKSGEKRKQSFLDTIDTGGEASVR